MKRTLTVAGILLGILAAVFLSWASRSTPYVRDRIIAALNAQYDSRLEADVLQVGVFPHPYISGEGLRLRYRGRTDVPPLIALGAFQASAGIPGLLGTPIHLRTVTLDHLDIRVPPGGIDRDAPEPDVVHGAPPAAVATSGRPAAPTLVIDEIISRAARLEIASGKPGRLPRVWDIENLVLAGYGEPAGARFRAALINPVPRGRIETSGTFGPWNPGHPGQTAVRGDYDFSNANLDVIDGISGILSSTGTFGGVLERLEVNGRTDTPDFGVDVGGQRVPLTTRFKALVDGTNGDTWLERVDAVLGETAIAASGAVVRTEDVKGRRVALDVQVAQGRLEDLLRLAVHTPKPPLTGRIDLTTTLLLPAGAGKVVDRLQLAGRFTLAQARFTNIDVQKKITTLSQRGRGDEHADGTGTSVVSNLRGRFALRHAELSFSELAFAVPGATVQLTGTYKLRGETMDFSGDLLTDASLADMTSGVKAMLARLAQPFFRRRGGGSKFPIRITGTRANPSFRVDLRRILPGH